MSAVFAPLPAGLELAQKRAAAPFHTKASALNGVESVKENAATAPVEDLT